MGGNVYGSMAAFDKTVGQTIKEDSARKEAQYQRKVD
jgi:hypothetical protein